MIATALRKPTACQRRRFLAPRGSFSLVELVLVLTITAVMAGIALPHYSGALARYRVAAAARRVAADLTLAQQWARTRSEAVTFSVNRSQSSYSISGLAALDHRSGTYRVLLGGAPYQVAVQTATFGNDGDVIFNGYGIPDSSGTVVVVLGGYTARVELDAASGRARVP
jgi:Tfp pilus assembly protein FimT